MVLNIIKVDLDLELYEDCITLLIERIGFLHKINMLKVERILQIELIKKTKYSCKITLKNKFLDVKDLIIIQAILGDDYKRVAITYRDYLLGFEKFNRLFDVKRYADGTYIKSERFDVTHEVLNEFELK